MRLTKVLNVIWKSQKRIHGRLHAGKNQRIVPVISSQKASAVRWMTVEQQNIELLENPYVTKEEEMIYGTDHGLRAIKKQASFERMLAKNRKPFRPDRTLIDHFEHLNVNKKWE